MVWTISVIFLSLWLLGVTTPSMMHGYIHILLGIAVAALVFPALVRKRAMD
jgi:Zn-dependent protease